MRIVCGTDFSPAAAEAAEVAAHLAHRTGSTLHLVHAVLPPWEPTGPVTPPPGEAYPLEQATLTEEAHRIGADGLHITTEVTAGAPDEVVTAAAGREGAHLVVLGATGHRAVDRWLLGSTAARAARESHVPVLVVRQPEGLHAWLDGKRPLRVLVGVEPGPSSDAALRWAAGLQAYGAVDITVARLVDPGVENRAAGATGAGVGLALRHDVEQLLHERLLARSSDLLGGRPARVVIRGALGRVDRPLTGVAEENAADLLVVGSHQRAGFRRWWHGSVSSGALHGALTNVVVVPWRGEGEGA